MKVTADEEHDGKAGESVRGPALPKDGIAETASGFGHRPNHLGRVARRGVRSEELTRVDTLRNDPVVTLALNSVTKRRDALGSNWGGEGWTTCDKVAHVSGLK